MSFKDTLSESYFLSLIYLSHYFYSNFQTSHHLHPPLSPCLMITGAFPLPLADFLRLPPTANSDSLRRQRSLKVDPTRARTQSSSRACRSRGWSRGSRPGGNRCQISLNSPQPISSPCYNSSRAPFHSAVQHLALELGMRLQPCLEWLWDQVEWERVLIQVVQIPPLSILQV